VRVGEKYPVEGEKWCEIRAINADTLMVTLVLSGAPDEKEGEPKYVQPSLDDVADAVLDAAEEMAEEEGDEETTATLTYKGRTVALPSPRAGGPILPLEGSEGAG
jgi:hypothetical protein